MSDFEKQKIYLSCVSENVSEGDGKKGRERQTFQVSSFLNFEYALLSTQQLHTVHE